MLSIRSYIQELQLVTSYQSLPSGPANAKNISGLLEQDGLGISCPISDGSLADTETLDSFSIGISKLINYLQLQYLPNKTKGIQHPHSCIPHCYLDVLHCSVLECKPLLLNYHEHHGNPQRYTGYSYVEHLKPFGVENHQSQDLLFLIAIELLHTSSHWYYHEWNTVTGKIVWSQNKFGLVAIR